MLVAVDKSRLKDAEVVPDGERARIEALVARFSREDLLRAFDLVARTEAELRNAAEPRYHLEMALLKWIHLRKLAPLAELIEQLQQQGALPAAGAPAGPGGTRPGQGSGAGRGTSVAQGVSPAKVQSGSAGQGAGPARMPGGKPAAQGFNAAKPAGPPAAEARRPPAAQAKPPQDDPPQTTFVAEEEEFEERPQALGVRRLQGNVPRPGAAVEARVLPDDGGAGVSHRGPGRPGRVRVHPGPPADARPAGAEPVVARTAGGEDRRAADAGGQRDCRMRRPSRSAAEAAAAWSARHPTSRPRPRRTLPCRRCST